MFWPAVGSLIQESLIHEELKSKTENNYDDIIEDEVSYIYNLPDDNSMDPFETQSEIKEGNLDDFDTNTDAENDPNSEKMNTQSRLKKGGNVHVA